MTTVARHRHRHRGRQDLVGARHARPAARRPAWPSPRASPRSRTSPTSSAAPTRSCSAARAARTRRPSARPTAGTRCRWHPRWPRRRARAARAFTIARPRRARSAAPADAAVTLVEGAGGPRSPLAADGDSVEPRPRARAPTLSCSSPPAGLGTINAVRLSAAPVRARRRGVPRLVVALNRFDGDDDLHRRNHGWLASDGFHLVTDPAELAEQLLRTHPFGRRIS